MIRSTARSTAPISMMTTDATQVTGSPHAGAGARPGDVLAERYELIEAIDIEGPSIGFRALDQETERTVLVRTLTGPPLDNATLSEVLERLRGLIGAGGRFLSSLLDADREGRRPFTVEAWPSGTPLSDILHARRSRGEALTPREVLPIAARLGAALGALPRGWHHGDVRAERVWVDTDGLRLTGPFLLSSVPGRALADRLGAIGPAALAYAPEAMAGRAGAPADRWGAAALVWEALTLRAPDRTSTPRELSPGVLTALRRLLDPEPGRRPADLTGLLEALARQASLPVPRVDPEPHAPSTPRATSQLAELDDAPAGASTDDTSRHAALPDSEDGLDPRLVRAALDVTLESGDLLADELSLEQSDPGLDPRLVRAALGVTGEETGDIAPARRRAARPAGQIAPEVFEELSSLEELVSDEVLMGPEAGREAPRPETSRRPAAEPASPRVAPRPDPEAEREPEARAHRAAQGREGGTAVIPRPTETPPPVRRARGPSGALIVVGAVIVAVLIVGLGFLVRSFLTEERSSAERSRQIQERLEQIRSGETADPP